MYLSKCSVHACLRFCGSLKDRRVVAQSFRDEGLHRHASILIHYSQEVTRFDLYVVKLFHKKSEAEQFYHWLTTKKEDYDFLFWDETMSIDEGMFTEFE